MLKFLSSMLCTSRIHPFSLGNYLSTSLIIGNFMMIRVTSVEWTWLELEGLLPSMLSLVHSLAFLQSPTFVHSLAYLQFPIQSCSTPN
jgi:hypothetical protein